MPDNRQQKHLTPAAKQRSVTQRSSLASRGLELALNVRKEKERDAVFEVLDGEGDTDLMRFRLQAEQGDTGAQFRLGDIYYEGRGVPQDEVEAVCWFRRAAQQGHAEAQFMLGVAYDEGRGVPQDNVEAVRWWHRAAEQGDSAAQYNLGLRYAQGRGVQQDYVQAHKWFNLAAPRFPSFRREWRDKAVQFREEVASKMTPAQIAEAQRLARKWKPDQ